MVSHTTVWRSLKSSAGVIRQKLKSKPWLLKCHKETRHKMTMNVMFSNSAWINIMFSFEKRFNLAVSNNFQWYNLSQRSREFFVNRDGRLFHYAVRHIFICRKIQVSKL